MLWCKRALGSEMRCHVVNSGVESGFDLGGEGGDDTLGRHHRHLSFDRTEVQCSTTTLIMAHTLEDMLGIVTVKPSRDYNYLEWRIEGTNLVQIYLRQQGIR